MPTLDAMFKLLDGYSSTIKRIVEGTDRASKSILGASKRTDDFNDALKRTEAATARASNGLSQFIKTAVGFAAVKKGMDLTDTYTNTNARLGMDTYTNTNARLGMITNSLAEQRSLQNDIFAAANRARGSYTEMASAASKMRMLAGDSFGSNQEAVAFTELLTKSLKVSGASTAEQNSAFLQISQAMAAGRLQGDEFRSVMENAPMVADAIAQYMGKSKGELKELSSQGLITADIVKNAMFQAAGDIEDRFSSMPMTFADVWQRIKNDGVQAFGGVFDKANAILNSEAGQKTISVLTKVVFISAGAFSLLLSAIGWVGNRLDVLSPIILGVAAAWAVYNATAGIGWLTTMKNVAVMGLKATADMAEYAAIFMLTWAQEGFNAALLACPITWIIGGIILLIAAFYAGVAAVNRFAGTSVSATGLIVGAVFTAGAFIGNIFIALWNLLTGVFVDILNVCISFAEFFANFLNNPAIAVMNVIVDLAKFVVDVLQSLAKIIDTIFGTNLAKAASGWAISIEKFKSGLKQDNGIYFDRFDKSEAQFDRLTYSGAFGKGYDTGKGIADKVSGLFSGVNLGGGGMDYSQFFTAGNPAVVKGTGKGGAVKVEADSEDIEWMRKLAERDYVARIAQNTLAPNIRVEFSGPITKETDTDSVMTHVVNELKDIIATAPEGVPV
mgnify:CR=1 FL=1